MKSCPAGEDARAEDRARKVLGFIAGRPPEDMIAERLAEEVGLGAAHLCGLFPDRSLGTPVATVGLPSEAAPRLRGPQIQDKRARRVLSAMLAEAASALTIGALAKSVGLTRRQLLRIFRRELGLTPSDVLLAIRMAFARRLLSDGVLSVKEVAAQCGMPEVSHFPRAFARLPSRSARRLSRPADGDYMNIRGWDSNGAMLLAVAASMGLSPRKEADMTAGRRSWRAALLSVSLAFLSFSAAFWLAASHPRRADAQAVPANVRPFVATISKAYYDPSGVVSVREDIQYARTARHSIAVRPRQAYPLNKPMLAEIIDSDREVNLFLEPVSRSMTTIPYSRSDQSRFLAGAWEETCPTDDKDMTTFPDGATLFGYSTLHVVKKWNSKWTTERWMAPELECFSLKEVDTIPGARTETTVVSIQEGEPSIDLLRAPEGYTERSPAEVESLYTGATGVASLWGRSLAKRLEAQYRAGRPQ